MILNAKCKKCRASGEKLFLKGDRCFSPKCIFLRRPHKPGVSPVQSKRRKNLSEYGAQLLEKQKAKLTYGISEAQMRRYFKEASQKKGSTSELLFQNLESRLDNIIFRMGMAASRGLARQLVAHGHFFVNGRKSRIPSRRLKIGDIVSIRTGSTKKVPLVKLTESLKKHQFPSFISFEADKMECSMTGEPSMEELKPAFNTSLIVEFYSLLKVK